MLFQCFGPIAACPIPIHMLILHQYIMTTTRSVLTTFFCLTLVVLFAIAAPTPKQDEVPEVSVPRIDYDRIKPLPEMIPKNVAGKLCNCHPMQAAFVVIRISLRFVHVVSYLTRCIACQRGPLLNYVPVHHFTAPEPILRISPCRSRCSQYYTVLHLAFHLAQEPIAQ